jgi:hypothetical protein
MTVQLSDPQIAILTPALARPDRCIYPVTAALKGGAVGNVAKSLLMRGLLVEAPAGDAHTVWRCADDGQPLTLCVSDQGMLAVSGKVEQLRDSADCKPEPDLATQSVVRPRGAAVAALLTCLRRPEGATIIDLQAATGWQAHSVRGALSAVIAKKLGHAVTSTKEDERGRVYRTQS